MQQSPGNWLENWNLNKVWFYSSILALLTRSTISIYLENKLILCNIDWNFRKQTVLLFIYKFAKTEIDIAH